MRNPLTAALLLLAIAAVIAFPMIPTTSGTGTPHAIYGMLRDAAGNGVAGASVFINNTRTLESLGTQTAAGGSFSVDISNYPLGYVDGDQIFFTAAYGQFRAYGNVSVVVGESAQYVNLALPCTSHIVKGSVVREDGAYTLNHLVNITEVAMGGKISKLVDVFGMYSIELAFIPGGYAAGDQMVVSCEEDGYEGAAALPISSSQVQWVNLTMLDVQQPSLSHTVPADAAINQPIVIAANISDNAPFTAVLRYIAVGGGFYQELAMAADAGGASDWDGNGAATPGVYGARIPAQTELGTIQYYIEARDAHNTATSPTEDASTAPHELAVIDVTVPTVAPEIPANVEAGFPSSIRADISDDVSVASAWVNWTGPGHASVQTSVMSYTGVSSTWSAALPALGSLGQLNVSFHARDSSGNFGRSPSSGAHSTAVVDTTPPSVVHTPLNSMEVLAPADLTLTASDNLGVAAGVVWVRGVGASAYSPTAMTPMGGGSYSATVPAQGSTGVLMYYLSVNDTVGNQRLLPAGGSSAPYQVSVVDAGTPIINHLPVEHAPINRAINISAFVRDDAALSNVTLSYTAVGGDSFTTVEMGQDDGGATWGNFSAAIPAPASLGNVSYFINATDGTNYIHNPALVAAHAIAVIDVTAPNVTEATDVPLGSNERAHDLGCDVVEDVGVSSVYIWCSEPGTGVWTRVAATYEGALANGTGRYSAGSAGSLVGANATGVWYYFEANDTSGNSATHPALNPAASPLKLVFPDAAPPTITHEPVELWGLNETLAISANITDDEGVRWAILTFKVGADASVAVQMVKVNATRFEASIPRVLRSANATYRISAGDAQSASLSPEYALSFVNAPPVMNSTTPARWPMGQEIVVSAMAEDDVGTRSVALMHRISGESVFTQLAMTKGLLGYWSAKLPAFDGDETLEYYFSAADDEETGHTPATAPADFLTLVARDVVPPTISHEPSESYRAGHKPIIVAVVTDDVAVDEVSVHYRNGAGNFTTAVMSLAQSSTNGSYVVQLPAVEAGTLEYHFTASDGANGARQPSADGTYYEVEVEPRPTDYVPYAVVIVVVILTVIGLLLAYGAMKRKGSKGGNKPEDVPPREQ